MLFCNAMDYHLDHTDITDVYVPGQAVKKSLKKNKTKQNTELYCHKYV